MAKSRCVLLLLLLLGSASAGKRRRRWTSTAVEETEETVGWSPQKVAEVAKASEAEAHERERRRKAGKQPLPLYPTHTTVCNGRPCRPGEGNLKGYSMWFQPYEHREAYVQSRSRKIPHQPDPTTTYADLVREARRVQQDGLVVVTAGDWDYRELIYNWLAHAHRLKYDNTLVLAMDRELYADLIQRREAAFDNSALLNQWNTTCLQRHIQAVRMERHLGIAALVANGISVLHAEATAIFLHDVIPVLRAQPADVDMLFQVRPRLALGRQ